jgi:hypothetical protein
MLWIKLSHRQKDEKAAGPQFLRIPNYSWWETRPALLNTANKMGGCTYPSKKHRCPASTFHAFFKNLFWWFRIISYTYVWLRFCYVVYYSRKFNGCNNCTLWSIIVVIPLEKCTHRTPSGVRELHTCIGLMKSKNFIWKHHFHSWTSVALNMCESNTT